MLNTQKGSRQPPEVLLYADSESDADMLYFGGVMVPDPFLAFTSNGKRIAVVSQLEFARVRKESRFDMVLLLEQVIQDAAKRSKRRMEFPASVIAHIARQFKIKEFVVSSEFPLGVGLQLKSHGVRLQIADGLILPEREFKSDLEADYIRQGNAASVAGFKVVEKILRRSEIRRGFIYHEGTRLTSEFVQKAIAIECLNRGAVAANSIVAGGDQACDPHCRGTGPLKANQLIIVDIFPRVSSSGYHGDMTRTYLKGRASPEQRELVHTVLEAEQWAIGEHRTGKSASKIYHSVMERFVKCGYRTGNDNGTPVGFIHGLGHGLGLAVHESPRVNASGSRLKRNQVITVEPGLYYPGLGGVRFEDVVRVGKQPELLSCHGYRWEIR